MNGRKVYVLDYDLISPLGTGREEVFKNLKNNLRAEKKISRFNAAGLPVETAAEITADLTSLLSGEDEQVKKTARHDRKFELLVAAYLLMRDRLSALFDPLPPERKGVILGLGADIPNLEYLTGEIEEIFASSADMIHTVSSALNRNDTRLNAVFNPFDVYPIYLAEKLGLGAFQKTVLTACSASTQAIAFASKSIKNGSADMVLAGGTDSILNSFAFMCFGKLGVLATDEEGTGNACKPFDMNRKGTMAGEAAGLCVLASESIVQSLGLTPRFELLGYGNTLDAHKITAPDPEGKGIRRALRKALDMTGIAPSEIDYINLHGTGTRNNDGVELDALKGVFGNALIAIPASSTKDRHGHAIAAAGIQEFAITCLCMDNGFIPGNLNLQKPIDTENVNLLRSNLEKDVKTTMTVNFAFGGVNTVLITRKI